MIKLSLIFKILLTSLFIFIFSFKVNAANNVDWVLLKENSDGKEWLDKGSLKIINTNEISILTKYEKPDDKKNKVETNLYVMRINCETNEYKDTSINGIYNFNSKWQTSDGDELIDLVIERSCTELIS